MAEVDVGAGRVDARASRAADAPRGELASSAPAGRASTAFDRPVLRPAERRRASRAMLDSRPSGGDCSALRAPPTRPRRAGRAADWMADDSDTSPAGVAAPPAPIPFPGPRRRPPPPGGPRRRRASASCASLLLLVGLAVLAADLDRVRDDDGGRVRPARPGEPAGVQATRATRSSSTSAASRLGILTGNQNRIILRSDQIAPVDEARDHRDRGQALLHQRGRGPPRHRAARSWPTSTHKRRRAGRLDDHPAVRQERARGPAQAHPVREAPRGRARLPPHAQVEQGEDPHRVPERDLLRQRRLRHRVGRAHVLRREPGHEGCGARWTARAPPS